MKRILSAWLTLSLTATVTISYAQSTNDSSLREASLVNCIRYALDHQPIVQQALIDQAIIERQIKGKLADWYPQLNFSYNLQHNFQLPTSIFQGNPVKIGVNNTSAGQFSLTQTIFDRDVLLASRTAKDIRTRASQSTTENKINIAVEVSKAFYNVLLTEKQIDILNDDIVRLDRNYKDAYNQYQSGIVDKTDYKRAAIALNNANAERKSAIEQLKARYAALKELMNYPDQAVLKLLYDSMQMEREAFIDTTRSVNYDTRIEYQLLLSQKRLQEANLKYNKWSYLPAVSAFGAYNLNFLNDNFGKLYNQNFPSSFAGLAITVPLFQGTKRVQQIREAELELKRLDYDFISLRNNINTEYVTALSSYKSNLNDYIMLKENLGLAKEVYNTIQLQYRAGIKTYLEVITAETDLRTAEVNYTNALYQVLSSKLDVQKALGTVQY